MSPSSRRYPERPLVGVGGVVIKDGQVLLVRRGRPPAKGQWSIPGGLVHVGEALAAALERELAEETGLKIRVGPLVYVMERVVPDGQGRIAYHYVVLDYLCDWLSGQPRPSSDADAAGWFDLDDLDRLGLNPETAQVIVEAASLARKTDLS